MGESMEGKKRRRGVPRMKASFRTRHGKVILCGFVKTFRSAFQSTGERSACPVVIKEGEESAGSSWFSGTSTLKGRVTHRAFGRKDSARGELPEQSAESMG